MTPEDVLRLAGIFREKAAEAERKTSMSKTYREGFADGYRSAATVLETLSGAAPGSSQSAEVRDV